MAYRARKLAYTILVRLGDPETEDPRYWHWAGWNFPVPQKLSYCGREAA